MALITNSGVIIPRGDKIFLKSPKGAPAGVVLTKWHIRPAIRGSLICYGKAADEKISPRQDIGPPNHAVAQLSEQTIKALMKIMRDEYGRDVSFAEASQIANTLVDYFDLLARIYHRDKDEGPKSPNRTAG